MTSLTSHPRLIFDAHLDLSYNAIDFNRELRWPLSKIRRSEIGQDDFPGRGRGTVCFPELRKGRIGCIIATQLARTVDYFSKLPGWKAPEQAWAFTQAQHEWHREMERCGELVQFTTGAQIRAHADKWIAASDEEARTLPIGYILGLEGADSLVTFDHLHRAYGYGLRIIGPAHYGAGRYAMGTDAEGPLPSAGHELLKEMRGLGMILDATHLCDESFWETMKRWDGPVWASHSNCRALADWNRQFDDAQIRELAARGAVIGMAFDAIMMVHGWQYLRSVPRDFELRMEKIVEHIDHICQLTGSARHVGIGSDLDGGYGTEQTPMDLGSVADLARIDALLAARGYSAADITCILHENFLRFLTTNLPG
jgi:membrane dipeptidase